MKNSLTKQRINIIVILFLYSLFWFIITPRKHMFELSDFYGSFSVFILGSLLYFKAVKKNNYFDFDTIFVCVYFLVGYFPTFFYGAAIYPYLFLHFPFDEAYINSSSWLFTIGILSYYIGRVTKLSPVQDSADNGIINTELSSLILISLFFVYIFLGGHHIYVSFYFYLGNNTNGVVVQIEILITAFTFVIMATELYNKKRSKSYKIKKIPFVIIAILFLLLLYVGNRTVPSYFILAFLGIYSLLFRSISFTRMCVLILLGIVGMWIVGVHRGGNDIAVQSNMAMYAVDMTINTRNTYVAMEYVDQYGFTYGKTMLYGILGIIPFLSSFLGVDKDTIGSAEVLTDFTYKNITVDRDYIGLGTNIIADIYLSFGTIGVIFFMFVIGLLVNKYTKCAAKLNYYSLVIFAVIMSVSVFGVRTGVTHPSRMIVWALLIAYLNKQYTLVKCRKK